MKRNTSLKGQIAETAVLNELVKQGFNVSIPFGDYRYDLIAEKNGHLNRIQVKYVSWITKRNTLQIIFHSITRQGRKKYLASDVDFFIAYHEPNGVCSYAGSALMRGSRSPFYRTGYKIKMAECRAAAVGRPAADRVPSSMRCRE